MRETIFPELKPGYNDVKSYSTNGPEVRTRFTIKKDWVMTIADTPENHVQPVHYHTKKKETIFIIKGCGAIVYYVNGEECQTVVCGATMVSFYEGISHTLKAITKFPNFSIKRFTEDDYSLGISENKTHPYIRRLYHQDGLIRLIHRPDGENIGRIGVYIIDRKEKIEELLRKMRQSITHLTIIYIKGSIGIDGHTFEGGIIKLDESFDLRSLSIYDLDYAIILKTSSR